MLNTIKRMWAAEPKQLKYITVAVGAIAPCAFLLAFIMVIFQARQGKWGYVGIFCVFLVYTLWFFRGIIQVAYEWAKQDVEKEFHRKG